MLIPYLITINAAGLLLMLIDKSRAKRNLWRIPEKMLLTVAALGGSVGSLFGMYIFRHKTKHTLFSAGIPALMFLHFILLILYLK